MHPQTAYRWFREGMLPVPAVRVNQRTVLVSPGAPAKPAAAAHGRRLVVLDDGEVAGDLVRDMVGVLTSCCACLCGRRSARNRALKAADCAQRGIGPQAAAGAGGQDAEP